MYRLLYTIKLLCAIFFASSCSNEYIVKGSTCDIFDGANIYIKTLIDGRWEAIDSCEILHGKFMMEGEADSTFISAIFIGNEAVIPIVIEEGNINVDIEMHNVTINGTQLNDKLSHFFNKKYYYEQQIMDLERKEASMILEGHTNKEDYIAIQDQIAEIGNSINFFIEEFIKEHYENVLGPCVFQLWCNGMPYPTINEQIGRILKEAPEVFLSDTYVKEFMAAAEKNSNKDN